MNLKKKLSNYSEMLKGGFDEELPALPSNKLYSGFDPLTFYAVFAGAVGILWQIFSVYVDDLDEKAAKEAGWYGGSQGSATPHQTAFEEFEVKPEPGKPKKVEKSQYV